MGFFEDAPPEAQRVCGIENEIESTGDGAPFVLQDGLPGVAGGVFDVSSGGVAGAALGIEVRNLIEDQRA